MARKKGDHRRQQPKPNSKDDGAKPKKPPLTHFLCLPLVNESSRSQLQKSLATFVQDSSGVGNVFHERAIRPVGALHFTIGTMSLMNKERLDAAIQTLQNLDVHELLKPAGQGPTQESSSSGLSGDVKIDAIGLTELTLDSSQNEKSPAAKETRSREPSLSETSVTTSHVSSSSTNMEWTVEPLLSTPLSSLRPASPPPWPRPASETTASQAQSPANPGLPLNINISALHAMQSPSKTSILFASAKDPSSRLLPFASALKASFANAGFLVPDARALKLHATVVNTIYAKAGHPRARRRRAEHSKQASREDGGHDDSQSVKQDSEDEHHDPSEKGEVDEKSEGEDEQEDETQVEKDGPRSGDQEPPQKPPQEPSQEPSQAPNFPLRFNATALIEKYKDFIWAQDVRLDRLAICEMGAKKTYDESGKLVEEKYTEVASIPLP